MQTRSVTKNNSKLTTFVSFVRGNLAKLKDVTDKLKRIEIIKKIYTKMNVELCEVCSIMKKEKKDLKNFVEVIENKLISNLLEVSAMIIDKKYRRNKSILIETGDLIASLMDKVKLVR